MKTKTGSRRLAAAAIAVYGILLAPAGIAKAPLFSAPLRSNGNISKPVREPVLRTVPAPAESAPLAATLRSEPLASLVRDYQALRWLANLSLSPAQYLTAARCLRGAGDDGAARTNMMETARALIALLQRERDTLAAHRPLSGSLMDAIQMDQVEQNFWQLRAEHDLDSAAQALFFTLSDNQRTVLAGGPEAPAPNATRAEILLERAVQADRQGYAGYRKRIQDRFPAEAGAVTVRLDAARSMNPAEFRKWLPSLADNLARVIDPTHSAARASDYQVASQLGLLLQSPAVQAVILRAADVSGTRSPDTAAAGAAAAPLTDVPRAVLATAASERYPSPAAAMTGLEALRHQEAVLQQQIEAVNMLSVYAFTPDDIVGGLDEMQKADELRAAYENHDRKVKALREAAVLLAARVEAGQGISSPGSPVDAAVVQSQQANEQDILADLQLSAMAMLTAMPQAQLDAVAADPTLPYRYVRAIQVLQAIRNQSLPQYLSSESSDVKQVESIAEVAASPAETAKVREILRNAREMSESAYGAGAADLARSLATLAHPLPAASVAKPAAAIPAAATPAVIKAGHSAAGAGTGTTGDNPLSPESEKQQLILNTTARRLAPFLNVPDLWKVLWHALPKR